MQGDVSIDCIGLCMTRERLGEELMDGGEDEQYGQCWVYDEQADME